MSIAAKKKALVDPYAQIALYDSAENQRVVMRDQILAEEKKGALPPAPCALRSAPLWAGLPHELPSVLTVGSSVIAQLP